MKELKSNKALIFGASGLVGSELLKHITSDKDFQEIIIFSRKPLETTTPRSRVVVFDSTSFEGVEAHFTPNAKVFCCIGTTRKKTPDLQEYKAIDYGIPVKLAEFAARGSCQGLYVVSALGANSTAVNFYQKMKGEMERDVAKRGVRETYFFRPSLLLGRRQESRKGEGVAQTISGLISPIMLGPLKRFKAIDAEIVAKAMWQIAKGGFDKTVISNEDLFEIANS